MRSITVKLLLAFLGISLVSVVLIVLLARWTTDREFRSYLFDQNRTSLLNSLANYYVKTGSWQGVEASDLLAVPTPDPTRSDFNRRFFTLVDTGNRVVLAGPGDNLGDVLTAADVQGGTPVKVNGVTVGVMVTRAPDTRVNPAANAFLERVISIFYISAAGVIALAILLAFLLSRTLTRPIRELTAATRAVSEGKPSPEVPVRSRDELGELASSFNRMNAELRRSIELRRQMTADIAHELRTPVSVILGHAEGVHDGVLPPSLETFEIIRDEAARLEHLIEDLRTLSRADAGELPIERHPVSPAKLLEGVGVVNQHRASQCNVSLQIDVEAGLPDIDVDPDRMIQVLSNVVDNALRYTPEGGSVRLSAREVEKTVEIRVRDSGPGIPADELDQVFDRFYRGDPSRQRDAGGSGLGLAIAKSIVEKHNGRIWAESPPGEGATIVIRLPRQA
jgi:two-component system sensor histidine kinase BaeS